MSTYALDTQGCSRCGGGGRHSWNQRDGDKCWGCNGTGKAPTRAARKVIKLLAEQLTGWGCRAGRRAGVFESTPDSFTPGVLALPLYERGSLREVVRVEVLQDQPCGWSEVDGQRVSWAWRCLVHFTEGEPVLTATNEVWRRALSPAEKEARVAIWAAHVGKGVHVVEAPAAATP